MDRSFDPQRFDEEVLRANGISTAFGVPDSSLSGLINYFSATKPVSEHVVTANEGAAVALAAGYYLSTRKIALVYMQNSGFANALNPLQTLAAKEVFGLPMLLVVGWRGKPGEKDEPQHALVGPRLLDNLRANDFPYEEIPNSLSATKDAVARLIAKSLQYNTPVALIVPRNTFSDHGARDLQQTFFARTTSRASLQRWLSSTPDLTLSRELAIRHVVRNTKSTDILVSSLGGNSRELYMIHNENGDDMKRTFFCIGAMGHTYALANGIAVGSPSSRIWCIDGDGSFLMHIGNGAVLADTLDHHVIHVVIYNGVHSSTGNQPLMIGRDSLLSLADGLAYKQKFVVDDAEGLTRACRNADGNTLIIVAVNNDVSPNLPRPSETPRELRDVFIKSLA